VYPMHDPHHLVAVVPSAISLRAMLELSFNAQISGVYCVVHTGAQSFTFEVVDGVAKFLGESDLHDAQYDSYEQSAVLTCSNSVNQYQISIYPSEDYFSVYSTLNPLITAIGVACIVVVTSLLFLLYDFSLHKEVDVAHVLLENKRRFVRYVSHEVRTPLNTVCLGLALLTDELGCEQAPALSSSPSPSVLNEGLSPATQRERALWLSLAQDILHNAQSAVVVLDEILQYDKIEGESLSMELSVVNVWALIEKTTREFTLHARKENVHLVLDMSLGDGEEGRKKKAVGDTMHLRQVLRNLLSNALKFTPKNGTLTVTATYVEASDPPSPSSKTTFMLANKETCTCDASGTLRLDVRDTGVGMSVDQLARLFEEGIQFNVNELQAGQGSGLGLFIAKGLVAQHQGSLTVSSEGLGRGSTFTVLLPLYHLPDEEDDLETGAAALPVVPLSAGEAGGTGEARGLVKGDPLHVLVVDDVSSCRKMLVRLMASKRHHCEEARDGQEAVEMVRASYAGGRPYNVVLMDFEMPVMNGPTATKELRDLGLQVLVIGVTGNVLPEDLRHFKDCGANAVLTKPLKIASLEHVLQEHGLYAQVQAAILPPKPSSAPSQLCSQRQPPSQPSTPRVCVSCAELVSPMRSGSISAGSGARRSRGIGPCPCASCAN